MKIKISKSQWEKMGRKAGWIPTPAKEKPSPLQKTFMCNQCANLFDGDESNPQCPYCYSRDFRPATREEWYNDFIKKNLKEQQGY